MAEQRSVITIGNFDGVHRGHQAMLERAHAIARQHDARVLALTFEPAPASVLRPGTEPPRLDRLNARIRRLKTAGADEVIVLEPTPELLGKTAAQFVAELVDQYRPVAFVEGPGFRFGRGRAGDMALLAELGRQYGFEAVTQPAVEVTLSDMFAAPVSSSLTRWLVGRGRVADAAICLARAFELTGPVVEGERRGRRIGVPTANLAGEAYAGRIVPADGVYAGVAIVEPEEASYPTAISVGTKPAFAGRELAVEAHLLDFADNLYGRTITLRFARWVRDQYAYPGVDALAAQLERDIALTRSWSERGLLQAG